MGGARRHEQDALHWSDALRFKSRLPDAYAHTIFWQQPVSLASQNSCQMIPVGVHHHHHCTSLGHPLHVWFVIVSGSPFWPPYANAVLSAVPLCSSGEV